VKRGEGEQWCQRRGIAFGIRARKRPVVLDLVSRLNLEGEGACIQPIPLHVSDEEKKGRPPFGEKRGGAIGGERWFDP